MESKRASRFPALLLCSRKQRKFGNVTPTSKAMPAYQTITLETIADKGGTIALITLNRPEKRNAISAAMIAELMSALADLESGSERVVIITGAGKAFCAGMDLDALEGAGGAIPRAESGRREKDRRTLSPPLELSQASDRSGERRGARPGAAGIATLCDFTLAVPEAKFGYTEVRIGFIPALVSMFLERQVGEKVGARSSSYRPDSRRRGGKGDRPGYEHRADERNS